MSEYVKAHLNPDTGKMEYKAIGSTIKALDGNRVSGYLVRFTNADDTDLHGEYFDKSTNFWLKEHSPIGKPIMIDHAFDDKFKSVPVGIIDFAKEDEIGIWIEGKLKDRKEYEDMLQGWKDRKYIDIDANLITKAANGIQQAVKTFFSTGKAQWSSGALPQSVEVDKDTGHIKSWAFIEGTGVYTPAEPDGTQIQIKSFLELLSNQLTDSPNGRKDAIEHKGDNGVSADNEPAQANVQSNNDNHLSIKGQSKMDENEEVQKAENPAEALAGIAEQLMAIAQSMGMSGDDAMAMASEVEDEIKAETSEEEDPEAVAEKAFAKLIKKYEAKQASIKKAGNKLQSLANDYLKAQPAVSKLPAFTGNGNKGIDNRAGMGGIIEHSPYKQWTPEDYSFAIAIKQYSMGKGKQINFNPDNSFYQEFADKAIKAYGENKLVLQNGAFKAINAIKSGEVQHSTLTSYGDEWVPTLWADNIWEKPRLDNVVQNIFQSIEMPSNPYEYPVESTDPSVYFVAETQDEDTLALDIATSPIPDSRVGTSKVTFSAKKFGLRVMWSAELQEDAIARLVPQYRAQAERAIQNTIDNTAINGDTSTTTNINADGESITATTRNYLAYDGLIHQPLVTATTNRLDAQGAAPTLGHLRQVRALLGSAEGYNPNNLAWVMDFPTYVKLLNADEIVTVDKYGSAATVVTGELGRVDGIPVFVSAEMALADADGKITEAGNVVSRGRAVLVHRPSWLMAFRRRIQQSLDYVAWYDMWILTMTLRNDFKPRTASNGTLSAFDNSTAILYNIGV